MNLLKLPDDILLEIADFGTFSQDSFTLTNKNLLEIFLERCFHQIADNPKLKTARVMRGFSTSYDPKNSLVANCIRYSRFFKSIFCHLRLLNATLPEDEHHPMLENTRFVKIRCFKDNKIKQLVIKLHQNPTRHQAKLYKNLIEKIENKRTIIFCSNIGINLPSPPQRQASPTQISIQIQAQQYRSQFALALQANSIHEDTIVALNDFRQSKPNPLSQEYTLINSLPNYKIAIDFLFRAKTEDPVIWMPILRNQATAQIIKQNSDHRQSIQSLLENCAHCGYLAFIEELIQNGFINTSIKSKSLTWVVQTMYQEVFALLWAYSSDSSLAAQPLTEDKAFQTLMQQAICNPYTDQIFRSLWKISYEQHFDASQREMYLLLVHTSLEHKNIKTALYLWSQACAKFAQDNQRWLTLAEEDYLLKGDFSRDRIRTLWPLYYRKDQHYTRDALIFGFERAITSNNIICAQCLVDFLFVNNESILQLVLKNAIMFLQPHQSEMAYRILEKIIDHKQILYFDLAYRYFIDRMATLQTPIPLEFNTLLQKKKALAMQSQHS